MCPEIPGLYVSCSFYQYILFIPHGFCSTESFSAKSDNLRRSIFLSKSRIIAFWAEFRCQNLSSITWPPLFGIRSNGYPDHVGISHKVGLAWVWFWACWQVWLHLLFFLFASLLYLAQGCFHFDLFRRVSPKFSILCAEKTILSSSSHFVSCIWCLSVRYGLRIIFISSFYCLNLFIICFCWWHIFSLPEL